MTRAAREWNRRDFLTSAAVACASAAALTGRSRGQTDEKRFQLHYILSSAMYGYDPLTEILPQVARVGAEAIDVWPKVHGNQREQIDEMGVTRFRELLEQHDTRLGAIACYRLGPFALADEMRLAREAGGRGVVLVCGSKGPKGLEGTELKEAIRRFVRQLRPHVQQAAECGCVIAIENHANSMIWSPDSIRWFAELATSDNVGIALAPHHLPQDPELIAKITEDIGPKTKFFYAQQHGKGSSERLPKEQELLQLPGRGELDFSPIVAALGKTDYQGYTSIFMHPVPRGIPILDSTEQITDEINRAREYLDGCVARL